MEEAFAKWWEEKRIRVLFMFDQELGYEIFEEIWLKAHTYAKEN